MNNFEKIKDKLINVKKPAQYIGDELYSIKKNLKDKLKVVIAFPDLYEIGMSYTGLQILYHLINKEKNMLCERVFSPLEDMELLLRENNAKLYTLESKSPLDEMDIIGFTFQYELSYTNALNILDLGNIPITSKDRLNSDFPIVFAGGPCVYNPEPLSKFIDVFYIGEAETELIKIFNFIKLEKDKKTKRIDILKQLNKNFNCLYIPVLEDSEEIVNFTIPKLNKTIKRTFPDNFKEEDFPDKVILPNTSVVYDRVTLEISRGCDEGCRFCQAGMIYRPTRERTPEILMKSADDLLKNTGHSEISLNSLSAADYPGIEKLVGTMIDKYYEKRISVALPSIRADRFKEEFANQIKKIRKTGFTIAPEAGSQRLRNIINKNLAEVDIINAAETAYKHGWDHVKLYFMIGLPFETDEDIEEMVKLTEKIAKIKRKGYVVLSVSSFVPKPHTPFQWAKQINQEEIERKQLLIKSLIKSRNIRFRYHESGQSFIEGIMARGDRKAGNLIEYVFKNGGRFDGWGEYFNLQLWKEAIEKFNYNFSQIHNEFDENTVFPWDFINTAVAKNYYLKEWKKSKNEETTPYCDEISKCNSCKACSPDILKNRFQFKNEIKKYLNSLKTNNGQIQLKQNHNEQRIIYLFKYTKLNLIKYISHLDLKTVLTRAMVISNLPVAFTRGFNPRPVINFAPALELGVEGENELFIAEFHQKLNIEKTIVDINKGLPEGIIVKNIIEIPFEKRNFLSNEAVTTYSVKFQKPVKLVDITNKKIIKKSKKGLKTLLVKDYIINIEKISENEFHINTLHSQQKGSLKITDIANQIFENLIENNVNIVRKKITFNGEI